MRRPIPANHRARCFRFRDHLVSNKSLISKKIAKEYQDQNTLLSLPKPFKNTKITIDDLITACDSNSITIQSPEAFSVFISAIKKSDKFEGCSCGSFPEEVEAGENTARLHPAHHQKKSNSDAVPEAGLSKDQQHFGR